MHIFTVIHCMKYLLFRDVPDIRIRYPVRNQVLILIEGGDGVTLKTPRPRGWVASARACGQKACLDLNLG